MSETMAYYQSSSYNRKIRIDAMERDGFVIIAVLWILGALSILASAYATYVISTAASVRSYDHNLQSEALVSAALELTAYRQLSIPIRSRPQHGTFSFHLGGANVSVDYRSEASRIDLNFASKDLLVGLFTVFGARPNDADTYAKRVIEWRTPPHTKNKAVNSGGSVLSYPIRGAKFPHPLELARVRDLPPELVRRALPFVTVYSGTGKIDIIDAAPQVIEALPGINSDRVDAFLAARRANPGNEQRLMSLLGPAQKFVTTQAGRTFRVAARVNFPDGRRTSSQVVILLFNNSKDPFSILSWHTNAFDSGAVQ